MFWRASLTCKLGKVRTEIDQRRCLRRRYHSVGSGGEGQRDPRASCGALWNQIFVFLEGDARLLGPPLAVRHVAGTRPRLTLSLEQVHVGRIGLRSGGTVATPATTTRKRSLHA